MSKRNDLSGPRHDAVPPLVAEHYVCQECGVDYDRVSIAHAFTVIGGLPAAVRDAVSAVPMDARRLRPTTDAWSVTEYVYHLRDVYITYTIRLHRARTEHAPVLEPMFNDLRARRFRYNERDVNAVLDELDATAAGFCDEMARTDRDQWDRVITRLPGEKRTALWLVRQALHEGQHHLHDIRHTGTAVTTKI